MRAGGRAGSSGRGRTGRACCRHERVGDGGARRRRGGAVLLRRRAGPALRVHHQRRAAQRHRRARRPRQRHLHGDPVTAADAILHQLPAGGSRSLRHDADPDISAALWGTRHQHLHRQPLHVQVQGVPAPGAGGVPSGDDLADGVCVPDADGDAGALRGRVPPAARALALHLRPRAPLRARHHRALRRLQPAALLGGGAGPSMGCGPEHHGDGRGAHCASPQPPVRHHLHQLAVHGADVLPALYCARRAQHRHLPPGAARQQGTTAPLAPAEEGDRPGHHVAVRGGRLLSVQHPGARQQCHRSVLLPHHRPAGENFQPAHHHQLVRQLHHLRDLRREVQAPVPQVVLLEPHLVGGDGRERHDGPGVARRRHARRLPRLQRRRERVLAARNGKQRRAAAGGPRDAAQRQHAAPARALSWAVRVLPCACRPRAALAHAAAAARAAGGACRCGRRRRHLSG